MCLSTCGDNRTVFKSPKHLMTCYDNETMFKIKGPKEKNTKREQTKHGPLKHYR